MPHSQDQDYSHFALGLTDGRIRWILDTLPQMVWSTTPEGMADFFNLQWYEFTGVSAGDTNGDRWMEVVHPQDRERAAEAWRVAIAAGETYEVEYRMRHRDGEYLWMLARARPLHDESGRVARWFGTCTDVDKQKRTEEGLGLIASELSHRIKNIFSVVISIISLSVPRNSAFRPQAEDILSRITALARAQDHFRPTAGNPSEVAIGHLKALIAAIMEPYQDADAKWPRLVMTGDDVEIGSATTTALALLLHELATNSVKYGAFSAARGQVTIKLEDADDRLLLRWCESGGPTVTGAPERQSFGTALAQRAATAQLKGDIVYRWEREGLEVDIAIPKTSLK